MKTTIVLSAAALVGSAIAQSSIADLPKCALPCVQQLLDSSNCPSNGFPDPECICTSQDLIDTVSCCVFKACTTSDEQQQLITFAQNICKPYPDNVLPASAGCSSSTVSSAASSTTVTSASTTLTSGSSTSTVVAASTTVTMHSSSTSAASSGSVTAASTSTPNSAPRATAMAGGVFGAVLGAAGYLL